METILYHLEEVFCGKAGISLKRLIGPYLHNGPSEVRSEVENIGAYERSSQRILWLEKFAESMTEICLEIGKSAKLNAI